MIKIDRNIKFYCLFIIFIPISLMFFVLYTIIIVFALTIFIIGLVITRLFIEKTQNNDTRH